MALAVAQTGGNFGPNNSVDSINATFPNTTVAGSCVVGLVAVFNTNSGVAAGNMTDNKSNSFQLGGTSAGWGSATEAAGIWYNNNGTRGSSHQVTINPPGVNHSIALGLVELTGQDIGSSTSCFDATTFAVANDTTSPFAVTAAASISGNQISFLIVNVGGASGSPSWSGLPSGYTQIGEFHDADTGLVMWMGYKLLETGTPTVSASWSGTVGSESPKELFATFKEASGGATGGRVFRRRRFSGLYVR